MPTGSCLCGTVTFRLTGDSASPNACHCGQCRKWTGHHLASMEVAKAALTVDGADRVTWFHSSEGARRGFCSVCGSTLFWEAIDGDRIDVAMGTIDGATGTHLARHIYVADKGDYYAIADGVPQYPGSSVG